MTASRLATGLHSIFAATAFVLFMTAIDARADVNDLLETCSEQTLDPVERIEACDRITNQGEATRAEIAQARTWRGFAYLDQERHDDARIEFRHALLFDAEDAKARERCIAAIMAMGGDEEGAQRAADVGCALVAGQIPSDADATLENDRASCDVDCPKINIDALAIVYLPDADPDVNTLLEGAKTHRAAENLNAAASAYARAGILDPMAVHCGLEGAQYEAAYILRLFDQANRAQAYGESLIPRPFEELETTLALNPDDPDALRERALLYMAVKAWDLAESDIRNAIGSDPNSADLGVILACVELVRVHRFDRLARHALIYGLPRLSLEDPVNFYAGPLSIASEVMSQEELHPLAYLTLGEAHELTIGEENEVRDQLAEEAYTEALNRLEPMEQLHGLDFYIGAAAHWLRSSVRFGLDNEEGWMEDIAVVVELDWANFRPACPED